MNARENVEIAARIFRDNEISLRSMVRRYGVREQDTEDICQDIFLAIARHPPSHEVSLSAYLKTVVRNHVRDFYRRTLSRRGFTERYAGLQKAIVTGEDDDNDGFDQMEQGHRAMELLKDALPPYMSRVLIERYTHGESIELIALKLGVKRRSVSRYCSTGIQRLRHLLDQ